jgi:hypothetical protein
MARQPFWVGVGLFLLLIGGVGSVCAQGVNPRRMVASFDFDEVNDQGVKLGMGIPLPPGWYPMGRDPLSRDPNFLRLPLHQRLAHRPGFPHHNRVGYSDRREALRSPSGFSLRLGIDGGSSGAYLEIGALPAVPQSDYLVTARVKTSNLIHAGARLRVYFINREGRRIEDSVQVTRRLRTNGEWTHVSLKLPGEFSRATYIGIEAELVQPTPDPRSPLGSHQLVLHDVEGEALFDDITLWQLPFVQISTANRVSAIRSSEPPSYDIAVRDLVGSSLVSRVRVYDHTMKLVAQDRRPMGWGQPSSWTWTPELPGYGWYLAELTVLEAEDQTGLPPMLSQTDAAVDSEPIAQTYNAMLWMPPGGAIGQDARQFRLIAEGVDLETLRLLPELFDAVGVGSAVVSIWDTETTLGNLDLRLQHLTDIVSQMAAGGQAVTLSLHPVPEELANLQAINTRSTAGVLAADHALWLPYLQPVLIKLNQRIAGWQLGASVEQSAEQRSDLPEVVQRVHDRFRHRAARPNLSLPWQAVFSHRDDMPNHLSYQLLVPSALTPMELSSQLALNGWSDARSRMRDDQQLMLLLENFSADDVGHAGRVNDLALKMVLAWEQDRIGTALTNAWAPAHERREAMMPDPLLGVLANVSERLAGYRAAGRLNLGEGRVAIIFEPTDGEGDGMIACWNVNRSDRYAALEMRLGESPVVHDIWGNTTPLDPTEAAHRVALSTTPQFITGVDTKLALLHAGFSIDEPFIESTQTPHLRTLRLNNPWPITISGRFTVTGPRGWTIRPFRQVFSIAPGDTLELPITLQFPIHEVAGDTKFSADFEFVADKSYQISMSTPIRVGLEDVRFEPSMTLEPGRQPNSVDAMVTCIVTNTGSDTLSLKTFASLPGHPRRERLIAELEPGQSVIRYFKFNNAGGALKDNDIRVGLRETNGPAVLNQKLSPAAIQ